MLFYIQQRNFNQKFKFNILNLFQNKHQNLFVWSSFQIFSFSVHKLEVEDLSLNQLSWDESSLAKGCRMVQKYIALQEFFGLVVISKYPGQKK